jgi:hypothetical protein
MLYHTIIVHLFRPMLKVDLVHSDIHPRDICTEAANTVSAIVRTYRRFYDFRVAHLAIPHILLSVCIVHLLYSKDNRTAYQNLVEGLHGLEDLHECHYFGARSFRIIHTLAKTWQLPWPQELSDSKLIPTSSSDKPQGTISPPADPLLITPNTVSTTGPNRGPISYSPVGHAHRRESLSMFNQQATMQLATHPAIMRPGSVPASHHQSPSVGHHTATQPYNPLSTYPYSQSLSTVLPNAPATETAPLDDTAQALFWNPIPGMPGPILPRGSYQQLSPMGLNSVLHSPNVGDRLGRDGFKMSEDWPANHVNGFLSGPPHGYSPQNTQPGPAYLARSNPRFSQPDIDAPQYQQPPHSEQHGSQEPYSGSWYSGQMS